MLWLNTCFTNVFRTRVELAYKSDRYPASIGARLQPPSMEQKTFANKFPPRTNYCIEDRVEIGLRFSREQPMA